MKESILTGSALIILLILLRRALRGRISPRVQYALWLLAAARLLIPGTLFTAPVTVLGVAEELRISIRETLPVPDSAAPDSPPAAGPEPSYQTPEEKPAPAEDISSLPRFSVRELVSWPDLVWKAGMAAAGGALAISNLAFYLRLRKARRRLDLPTVWSGKLPVYEAEGLASPCLFGLFRPAVYLNVAAMDAEHPEHILAHEYAHYRHGDHVWSVLRSVCLAVHWYNPLVWWAAVLSRRDCELACDEAALRRLGEAERIDYGQTLLGMVSKGLHPAALFQTATTMTAGKRAMAERIALIVKAPRTRKATLIAVALAACLLVSCAFGGRAAVPKETAPSRPLEFPGLRWNDSVETVIKALDITEDQILEQGEDASGDNWCVVAENIPAFGGTAEKAYLYFRQYEGSEWGLYSVRLDYPNDEDFGAVREEMVRQYGPGGETAADAYTFTDGGQLQKVSQDWSLESGSGFSQLMLDIYGQETLDRRAEILEQPGPHSWHWSLDSGALPEEFLTWAADWFSKNSHFDVSPETSREYFRLQPMVRVFWADAAPLNWMRLSTTFNQVCLDASEYVFFLQCAAGGERMPAAVTVGQPASSDSNDAAYITDPAEVARLWALYQSFEYEGSYDPDGMGGWPVSVSFRYGDSADDGETFFILSQHGIYTQDGESLRLKDIDEIYAEFLRLARTGPSTSADSDPTGESMADNARSIAEQVRRGEDASEWLPLMRYMDWGVLARAAVEAGLDKGDGSAAVADIIGDIGQYIERQGSALTQEEYICILSASTGLDGAPAEGYGSMIYKLYTVNPGLFAYVTLAELQEAQRNETLDRFRGEWMFHREPYQDTAPSREEAAAQLAADLEAGVGASASEITLNGAGEVLNFRPVNAYGVYDVAYTSSDPGVTSVAERGTVTAVSPGEAVITMRFEGTGQPKEFTCRVTCQWESADAPQDDAAEPSGELLNEWQRGFSGFVFAIPAMPDRELVYDGMEDGGLEKAVISALDDYYQAYVEENGSDAYNDRFSRVILESAVPAGAGYGEAVTVRYQVECLRDRELNGRTYTLAPQSGESLSTTFTVMEQMAVMDQILVDGVMGNQPGDG